MTLEALYEEIGGDYQSVSQRLRSEERIKKFVLLFLKDRSYESFLQAVEQGNPGEAFRAVHTLKGVCMNLSFDSLYHTASEVTEYLRAEDLGRASQLLPILTACYEKHVKAIRAYEGSGQKEEEKCGRA